MKVSENCIKVIKYHELFRSKPYLCPVGKPTIGYGTTVYLTGKAVTLKDAAITEPKACELLAHDVLRFEKDVNSLLKVVVTQSMFDALVSFSYNVGSDIDADTIAEGLGDSTLLKLINKNIMATDTDWKKQINKQFTSWIYGKVKGVPTKMPGLIARRSCESLLFTDGIVKYFN